MKCEKCNENEANFYYKSMINGKTTEVHLCGDCAQEEGLTEALNWQRRSMFGSLLSDSYGMPGDFFGPAIFPGFGRNLLIPVLALPRIEIQLGEEPHEGEGEVQKAEANIPEDAGTELKAKRELLLLKNQLQDAVKAEDFEKAIELRDKIKEIEK